MAGGSCDHELIDATPVGAWPRRWMCRLCGEKDPVGMVVPTMAGHWDYGSVAIPSPTDYTERDKLLADVRAQILADVRAQIMEEILGEMAIPAAVLTHERDVDV